MRDVLIVVDMQNDFIDGSLGTKEAVLIVPAVEKKISEYAAAGKDIIFTRDTHGENYMNTFEGKNLPVAHCIKDSQGWQIRGELLAAAGTGYDIIDKPTFGSTDLVDKIKNYSTFEFCGLCTDICVISNVLVTRMNHYESEITVDSCCCAGVTVQKHEAALEVMRSCQVEVL